MEDIVCNGCSLLCDDGAIRVDAGQAKSLGLCRLGHAHLTSALDGLDRTSVIRVGSVEHESSIEEALERASSVLSSTQRTLILIGSQSSNETIREALSLASTLRGVVDSSATLGLAQAMSHAIHDAKLKIDLDYVRNRGEFILYWGTDPTESSHRHSSRFSVFPRGERVPQGVESRVIGVVDVRETETMKMANHRIVVPAGSDSELARAIVSELSGKTAVKDSILGIPAATFVGLVRALQKSDCTVIFYGTGVTNSGKCDENLSALARLIQTLRDMGKEAHAMPMWQGANDMGAVMSVDRVNGSLGSLDYGDGKPASLRPNTAVQKLAGAAFDSALAIGGDPVASLPSLAARQLAAVQTVYIGPRGGLTDKLAVVSIHVADDIITGSGSLFRIDGTEIRLKAWGPKSGTALSMKEAVARLHGIVQKRRKC